MIRWYFIIFIFLLIGCKSNNKQDQPVFQLLTPDKTSITFENTLTDNGDLNIIEYLYYYNGGGVAVADINNDGLEDIFFTGNQVDNKLYLNLGDMKFLDISNEAGINAKKGWATGISAADINGDGWVDFYVCQVGNYKSLEGHNLLFINNQDNTFTESAAQYGLDFSGFSTQAAFFDFDRDGDLDMYLLNHAVHTSRSYQPADTRANADELSGDRLFENVSNVGGYLFKDVSQESGIFSSPQGYGLGLVIGDINGDSWPDIYVGNDFHENDYLYINQQNGTFKESLSQNVPHTSRFTMGVDMADMNQDGLTEIFTLDMLPDLPEVLLKSGGEDTDKIAEIKSKYGYLPQFARNCFQLNKGDGTFADIALITDTYATDWSWSVLLADYDNDGLRDIFISNGIFKRPNDLDYINFLSNSNLGRFSGDQQDSLERVLIASMPSVAIPNVVFQQQDHFTFVNQSKGWGLSEASCSGATAWADLDRDGDLDLVISNVNQQAFIYENKSNQINLNHSVSFKFLKDSLLTIGVSADLYAGGKKWNFNNFPIRGFQSSVSTYPIVGLGQMEKLDSLIILWPNGLSQKVVNLKVDTMITVHYDPQIKHRVNNKTLSQFAANEVDFLHVEDDFRDYDRELLIPHRLSLEGPALAFGDINNDGVEEVFIGGSHGFPGMILFFDGENYQSIKDNIFGLDRAFEDVAATFFDFDLDGDLDLYVVSGGNVYPQGSEMLKDRIYLNDGAGNFSRHLIDLPSTNGSCVAMGDSNQDGFPDLFVGSRAVPTSYGQLPPNLLLVNNQQGGFNDPIVLLDGMVTDAKWNDMDDDGDLDLVIVGEWVPITILENSQGKFHNKTDLPNTTGWWRSVEVADVNLDGRPDIIAGNLGLNSKVKANSAHPANLYVNDFDKNGQTESILFYHFNGQNIPLASKDQLVGQMPMLKKKFLSYSIFSNVQSVDQLFDANLSSTTNRLSAVNFTSTVFIQKESEYERIPLPFQSQLSPINDFVITDWNDDQIPDLIHVGNSFAAVANRGNYDGNPGLVLLGKGDGNFIFDQFLPLNFNKAHQSIVMVNGHYFVSQNSGKPVYFYQSKVGF